MAQNDFSDIGVTRGNDSEISPLQLPIRGEKRIVPAFVPIGDVQTQLDDKAQANGQESSSVTIDQDSFNIAAALRPFVDYLVVRIPHRGFNNGQPDPSTSGTFRFLINPATIQVTHTTVDAQSMTRAGWQFGVWGDDAIMITMSGQTAGQYFALGLTDLFQEFTKSWRNLQQLVMVYENNGYWFEGEELGEGPLAADFARRRIKMHQDVEILCGNFIWAGMFDTLQVTQDATKPFLANFTITFLAWKERFRTGSPYLDSIHNDVQRGHSYAAFATAGQTQNQQQQRALPGVQDLSLQPPVNPSTHLQPPAVLADAASQNFVTTDTGALDQTPMFDVFNPSSAISIFSRT